MNEKEQKSQEFMTKTWVVWVGALICCLLWGSAFPCIKIGYVQMQIASGDSATQILYAGCRFTLAGVLVIIFGSLLQKKFLCPKTDELPKIAWLSLFQTILQYVFFYIGLAHASGVKASIIEGLNVFVAILIAGFIFHQEKVTSRKLLGCLVGFLGVVCMNLGSGGLDGSMSFFGEGFVFLSTIAYAISSVYLKKFSKDHNPVLFSGYQFLIGGIVMIVIGLMAGGHLQGFTIAAFAMLLYLACVSAVAYTIWGILLKYNPVSRVAVFGFMNPVFGVLLSTLLLQESDQISALSILALVLVSVGIYIVNRGEVKS